MLFIVQAQKAGGTADEKERDPNKDSCTDFARIGCVLCISEREKQSSNNQKEEKALLTINGIEPGDIRLPHFPGPIVEWPFGGVL